MMHTPDPSSQPTPSPLPRPGEAVTVCPKCHTQFFIRQEQIIARQGFVRCGACRGIFNALQHLRNATITPVASVKPTVEENPLTIMPAVLTEELPTPSPSSPESLEPPKPSLNKEPIVSLTGEATPSAHNNTPPKETIATKPHVEPPNEETSKGYVVNYELATDELEDRRERQGRPNANSSNLRHEPGLGRGSTSGEQNSQADDSNPKLSKRQRRLRDEAMASLNWPVNQKPKQQALMVFFWWALFVLLALMLVLQMLMANYQTLKELVPQSTPFLNKACELLDYPCEQGPRKQANALHLQGSELQADPAHKGLFVFTATMRNISDKALAFPSLILSLNGLNNQLLTRKVLPPELYVPGQFDLKYGMPANSEMEFKVFLQTNGISPIGFDARHAYLQANTTTP